MLKLIMITITSSTGIINYLLKRAKLGSKELGSEYSFWFVK